MKKFLLEDKKMFFIYLLACFIPIITQLLQNFTLALVVESVERKTMEFFRLAVIGALAFILLHASLFILSRMMRIKFMRNILLKLRIKAFDKIMNMSYRTFNKKSRDVYISNMINDINTFENTFFVTLLNVVFRIGYYFAVLSILIVINPLIGLIVFGVSIFVFLISRFYEKRTIQMQKDVSTEHEIFTTHASNTFNGLEILKLNNIEDKFLLQSQDKIGHLEQKKLKFNLFVALQQFSNNAIGQFVMFGLVVLLMYQPDMRIGYGEIFLTVSLSSNTIFPLMNLMPMINTLKSSNAIFHKITDQEDLGIDKNGKTAYFNFNHQIEVKDLRFQYDEQVILKSVSMNIEKGKKYLLKGPSGSGKSTLMKLLAMMDDVYQGDIRVDGTDYHDIKLSSFNDKSSFIYQDVFLFEASLFDNITLFKPMDRQWVLKVIEFAGLSDFLAKQEQGLDTMISENGKNLSGGERQRISIARALAKRSELLFVDEATSSLNDELGRQIEQTLLNLDQTVIAISHKYYEGITNHYDYVLEIKDGYLNSYPAKDYFNGGYSHEA
jgi:ABC-type multidrug transport system fused ATPase/permease subunit